MALRRTFTLNTGATTPAFGLGTWRSKPGQVEEAVSHALKTGYTHIDCAWCYMNENEVGEGIRKSGVPRSQIFITSKLWNTFHRPEHVRVGFTETITNLGVDSLDLYLMHWPIAHENRGDGNSVIDPATGVSKIDDTVTIEQTWREMEKLYDEGKAKAIGVSNFNIRKLKELLAVARIKPAVNQVELHPYLPQNELVEFCKKEGILVTAYSPLGSTPGPDSVLNDPVVLDVAQRNGKTPAQVLVSWAIQRGTQVIPKTVTPERIVENFQDFVLSDADFQALSDIHKRKTVRYIDPLTFWKYDMFEEGKKL
eukprot:jgi/Hompol1/18/HPOL_002707-RA